MGCGASRAHALNDSTQLVVLRFHLDVTETAAAYLWFQKLYQTANRTKTNLDLSLSDNRALKLPDLRACLGLPSSMLTAHLFELVHDRVKPEEFTFPEFLELCALCALATQAQLLVFAYYSFNVERVNNSLDVGSFVAGLSELKILYPGIVNGQDIPVSKLGLAAQNALNENALKGGPSTHLDQEMFTQLMMNQVWLLLLLTSMQKPFQHKICGVKNWQHKRAMLLEKEPAVLNIVEEKMKFCCQTRARTGSTTHSTGASTRHIRRVSVMHSKAMEHITRKNSTSLMRIEDVEALKQIALAAQKEEQNKAAQSELLPTASLLITVRDSPSHSQKPKSIMKRKGSISRTVQLVPQSYRSAESKTSLDDVDDVQKYSPIWIARELLQDDALHVSNHCHRSSNRSHQRTHTYAASELTYSSIDRPTGKPRSGSVALPQSDDNFNAGVSSATNSNKNKKVNNAISAVRSFGQHSRSESALASPSSLRNSFTATSNANGFQSTMPRSPILLRQSFHQDSTARIRNSMSYKDTIK